MKSNTFALAAVLLRFAAAAPAPAPQEFDFDAILDAPSPSMTAPPTAVVTATSVFSIDTASLAASISADVTEVATASITGASASAASTQTPTTTNALNKRTTSTTSSTTACPTTPEAGTYCGFINPEDPCAVQPAGSGPQVQPDTTAAFLAYQPFQSMALNAPTPSGYVQTFKDLNGATTANSYITYKTLTSYDVPGCAAFCDSTALCTAFNIYIERDPSLNPTSGDASNGSYCPAPPSITNYKCSLWGSNIDANSATNTGQTREQFQVVIVASNGYDKTANTTPAPQPGWNPPTKCGGGAISSGGSFWMGSNFYPGPFDPSVCAIYAQAQTNKNKQNAKQNGKQSYTPCNMFNAYMVHKNGIPQGTYCSIFNTPLSNSWAGFLGAWSGINFFGVKSSWTYSLTSQLSGSI